MFEQLKKITPEIKSISSVADGSEAFVLQSLQQFSKNDIVFIASDGSSLAQTASILRFIAPETDVFTFPAWDTVPYDRISPNVNIVAERVDVLAHLALNQKSSKPRIIVTSVGAVMQKLPPKKVFLNSVKSIQIGSQLSTTDFLHYVSLNGYSRVEQVMEPGEYAIRGDILDIFPAGSQYPLRIDLFGDEVEKIRTFDVLSQRTSGEKSHYTFQAAGEVILDENTIKSFRSRYREAFGVTCNNDEIYEAISNSQKYMGMENWLPFFYEDTLPTLFDDIPQATIILGRNAEAAMQAKNDSIIDHYQARLEALSVKNNQNEIDTYRPVPPQQMFLQPRDVMSHIDLQLSALNLPQSSNNIDIATIPSRNFSSAKNITPSQVYIELLNSLVEYNRLSRIICCYTAGSRERIFTLLNEAISNSNIKVHLALADNWQDACLKAQNSVVLTVVGLQHGFRSNKFYFISEQDILGPKQNHRSPRKVSSKDFIADVSSLNIGELVVHLEHGIGRFMGLENISAGGADHDCLKIIYANDDKLFVPVENIEMVSRYGADDDNIQLDTLGGTAWEAKKSRVKKRIHELAEKLIAIAARRQLKKAETYIASDGLYDEFCSGFPYNETDDQLNAINDVMNDLSAGIPMDRLICGDVGFGKTEVALRAAFIVAMSGAQVALIVPTTLLARQHYLNFQQRMNGFPLRVAMLSRLTTVTEARKIKAGMKDGSVDIVIGTHALLSDNIEFNNLGLLIIDEEQHFGVAHKEKLKAIKNDIHVLTLTATPIPRTLQLSLTGVKQLSIIATPPVDRLAARTFVMPFDRVMIKEAIYREKFRGGQSFVVCPRVSDIPEVQKILKEIAPDIEILVAHGQMPVKQLEDVMSTFVDKKGDVLLSTTIIESGIDMPSVNTMIVYRADMFGLAQLYQLRGRIGRSKVRGYCYFTIPQHKMLKPIAERRLNILQALDSLGAGFSLASHDMDIRGSGNVLGEEQSGHIKDVGIALYHHMLEEEIIRIKNGEKLEEKNSTDWSPQIITGVPIMISEHYVHDLGVRLGLYKRIGSLEKQEELLDMREELVDRFGPIPPEVENLLKTVEIKQLCRQTNIERIDAGAKGFVIGFHNNNFKSADKLVMLITQSGGSIKIRPDQRIFISCELDDYNIRLQKIKDFISRLNNL